MKKTKSQAKKVIKKKKRAKKKIAPIIGMTMEEIYSVINITQVKMLDQNIIIDAVNAPVIENVLKDCEISFRKELKSDGLHYFLKPPPKKEIPEEDFFFNEDLPDECIEDGFCF